MLGAILLDSDRALLRRADPPAGGLLPRHAPARSTAAMLELSERSAEIDIADAEGGARPHRRRRKGRGRGVPRRRCSTRVPDVANVEHYARIVKEKSTLRRLIQAGQRIVREGLAQEQDAEQLLGRRHAARSSTSPRTRSAGGFTPIGQIVKHNLEVIEDARNRQGMLSGLPTGFTELDRMTSGLQSIGPDHRRRAALGRQDLLRAEHRPARGHSGRGARWASSRSRCPRSRSDSAFSARRRTWTPRRCATASPPGRRSQRLVLGADEGRRRELLPRRRRGALGARDARQGASA